jgi:hypothetical protein
MSQSVAAAIGPQSQFNKALKWVHILFAVAFSVKALAGVFMNVSGLAVIGALAGIVISDITVYLVVNSWQKRELVGAQKGWSYMLYALAMGDVFFGAIAASVGWGGAYYAWGMWAFLVGVFVCYVVVAVVVNPAAQADEAEKMSNLRVAQAEHHSTIEERRNRADAKLLKAREAAAIRQARWSTLETFFSALTSKPLRADNRIRISRRAGKAWQKMLGEVDAVDVSRQLPTGAATRPREIVLEPSGDGMGAPPPSFG